MPICKLDGKECDFRLEYRYYRGYGNLPPSSYSTCRHFWEGYPTHTNMCMQMDPRVKTGSEKDV